MTNVNAPAEHDWLSATYVDEWVADWSVRADRESQLRRVAVALPIPRDARIRVLDVGGGWGPLTEAVLAWRPNATVTLLDYAPRMLAHASERLARYSDRVPLVERDLADPEWTSGLDLPFDAVVSALAIHNLEDPDVIARVYKDIRGSLRQGGCFCNLEVVFSAGPTIGTAARRLRADNEGGDPETIETIGNETGPDPAPRSIESQFRWLREAGFSEIDCLWRENSLALLGAC